MEQLDIFGNAEAIDTPATKAAPAAPNHEQPALFRPDFRDMRAPKARKAAAPVDLDPALHTDALI